LRENTGDEWEKLAQKERRQPSDKDRLATALAAHRFNYLSAAAAVGDTPLLDIKSNGSNEYYRIAAGKGVLVLHELRQLMGDGKSWDLMDKFGREPAGKPVASADFVRVCTEKNGADAELFFDYWLKKTGLPRLRIEKTSNGLGSGAVA